MTEMVNHPSHYGGDTAYECIKVLKEWLPAEQFSGFCRGNAIKYLCRAGEKDDAAQDVRKAEWYCGRLADILESGKEKEPASRQPVPLRSGLSSPRAYFDALRRWSADGSADKYIDAGVKLCLPTLKVPAVECCGEHFDEIDLKKVSVIAVRVRPERVAFCFMDILFIHDIDKKDSGKPFDETPLGTYLARHFADALKEYAGDVKVSLLTEENVFDEESGEFMPYFKPIKNRIKVLADENDTWYWWLKTPGASGSPFFCTVNPIGHGYSHAAGVSDGGVAPAFEITA